MIDAIKNEVFDICVGVIAAANGIKGYVKIKCFTETPYDIENFKTVCDPQTGRIFNIKVITIKGDCVIASVEGVKSRNEAERLQNTKLYISRDELPVPSSKEEYYHTDLVECQVRLENGLLIGKIQNVHNFGAGDIIEIRDELSNKDFYYPFNKEFVKEVNINSQYIVISQINEVVAIPE